MKTKQTLLILSLLFSFFLSYGQTLSAGDIAFVQYNADGTGTTIKFIALRDIPAGEIINFTDNGWSSSNSFRTGEGTVNWTSSGVNCGDVVSFNEGGMNLATGGDQILAYQGASSAPTFIAAIQMNGGWGTNATSTNTSAIPTGLTDSVNCLSINPEIDNAKYNGTLSGTKATILAAINNSGNWTVSNTVNQTFSGSFVISDCGSATPTITLSPSSLTGLDYVFGAGPSAEQTFTASGTNLVTDVTGNITLTAPTNFEISTTSGSGFGGTVTLTQSGGTVASTTIYTRLVSGLAVNTYGGTLTANSNGATTQNVTCTGAVTSAGGGGCSELLISEYVEGSDSNKYLELYNPTGASINLANYKLALYVNGSATATTTVSLSGSLSAYSTYVIANSGATIYSGTIDLIDSSITNFNGNDAIAIQTSSGANLDVIGVIGNTANFAQDVTLVRKSTVQSPVTTYNASEWTSYAQNDVSNLGSHTSDCFVLTPTITISKNSLLGLDYIVGTGPSAEQTFTVSGTLLTTDITLTAPTNFEISLTSGSGFGSSITLNQSGGTVNSTTIYTRLKTALAINSYTGDLTATSTGASSQSITFYGDVLCNSTQTITSFTPTSGPVGTSVTITGTGFTASSIADFDGVSATVTYVNATTLKAIVPSGAITGTITVTEAGCGLDSSTNFSVLEDNGCVGDTIPAGYTDLMFTGIYDDPISSCHYFELLNPTLSDIDLSTYSIGFDNNFIYGSAVPTSGFKGGSIILSGIIAAQTTVMVQVSSSGVCNTCSTIIPDLTFANGGINLDDRLVLLNGSTAVDVWQNNSARPGYTTDFDKGYIYSRLSTANAPSTTFNINDWNANGTENCFGFSLSSAVLPTIETQPTDVSGCGTSASFTVSASPGGGGALTYQWKYNDGSATSWSNVTSSSFAGNNIGFTSTNLIINGFNLDGYQFYCEVTESGSCTVMSNAARVNTQTSAWNGTSWSNGAPNLSTTAVINGNYNTTTNGSFSACSLFVNAGFNITVDNSTYVEVENDAFVDGNIVIETKGAFVQNNDSGDFTVHASGSSSVNKTTAFLSNWYNYTYWSSPVFGETVETALSIAPSGRRFYFKATNFVDMLEEIGNTGTFLNNPGADDLDDNGDDWQYASGVMNPGVGYASTVNSSGFVAGLYTTSFNGPFNNGVITTPIVSNSGGLYNDWNFIGNPYPSAINALTFLSDNVALVDAFVYLWSQATPPDGIISGNYVLNFSNSDYATITGSGVNVAGASTIIPNNFIPLGQGFFVEAVAAGNVSFNNAMRIADTSSNDQFFRSSNSKKHKNERNILWIDLKSNNGVFNQLAVSYLDGATDANDGSFYDVKRSESSGNASVIYSIIDGDSGKYAVQGKKSNSLSLGEIISLGFKTSIDVPTNYSLSIAQTKGDFFKNNTIYLKDNLLMRYHDLSKSDYSFTSEVGTFNDRFKIVFIKKSEIKNEFDLPKNDVLVIDIGASEFNFIEVDNSLTIKSVEIVNMLGKIVRKYKGNHNSEIFDLSGVQPNMYIAKIELSNRQMVIKKIIKKE